MRHARTKRDHGAHAYPPASSPRPRTAQHPQNAHGCNTHVRLRIGSSFGATLRFSPTPTVSSSRSPALSPGPSCGVSSSASLRRTLPTPPLTPPKLLSRGELCARCCTPTHPLDPAGTALGDLSAPETSPSTPATRTWPTAPARRSTAMCLMRTVVSWCVNLHLSPGPCFVIEVSVAVCISSAPPTRHPSGLGRRLYTLIH